MPWIVLFVAEPLIAVGVDPLALPTIDDIRHPIGKGAGSPDPYEPTPNNMKTTIPNKWTGKYMRPLLFVAVTLMLAACENGPSEAELAARAETEALKGQLQSRDSLIGEMTLSFDDIEKNLALMDDREKLLGESAQGDMSVDKRKKILRDVQLMNGLMKESRDRIAELTKRLDRSKIEAGGLRKKLKELDLQLAARDSSIMTMKDALLAKDFQIGQVNEQLSAIELEVAKHEAFIEQQTNQMNTAWYTVGTSKDLEERGVVVKSGGVIGIGKTRTLSGDATASQFQQVDVRQTHRVTLEGKKATLLTEHPKTSYSIVEEGEKLAYLEIKDPEAFWRLSKYMVVEVRN